MNIKKFLVGFSASAILMVSTAIPAFADSLGINFETYFLGNINGQDGWSKTGPYDSAVASVASFANTSGFGFGDQALRISNAVTSGSFGDQTISPGLTTEAKEGTTTNHFEASFSIGSTQATQQSGLFLSVSPDDGQGSRMSYVGFNDQADGIHVIFYDVTDPGPYPTVASFNGTDVVTIDRTNAHTIKFVIDLVPGPANDVVKLYVDGFLEITGTTWEDYYRYDPEQTGNGNVVPGISHLIMPVRGTAAPATAGNGFLIDNLSLFSGPSTVKVTIDKFIDNSMATAGSANNSAFPMSATWNAANIGSGTGSYTLSSVGFNSSTPYEAVTANMSSGADYSTNEVTGGSVVGTDCSTGQPYALVGYTTGDTLVEAQGATKSLTIPSFTNIRSDKYVIVWNEACPTPVTVTIAKYLDGVLATAASADNASYPMFASWNATNLGGAGTGSYSLGPAGFNNPIPYEATTSNMTSGSSYSTNEVTDISSGVLPIGADCQPGRTRLVGYSSGDSLTQAALTLPGSTSPSFTNILTNKFAIVWNESCPNPTPTPTPIPLTDKNQCKNGGWQLFSNPTFRNQGDCVSYVQSNEHALGNRKDN